LARKRCKGTRLKVFSGKEARLNRVILLILSSEKLLTKYEVFVEVRHVKGFRHVTSKTVYRRMESLKSQGMIVQKGTKLAKPGWTSDLFSISLKGKAVLKLGEKSIEALLEAATDEQLLRIIELLS